MTLFDIISVTGGKLINGDLLNCDVGKLCIDSRVIEDGDIFVCLKGKNTDGNKYIDDVIDKASMIITDECVDNGFDIPIVKVDDVMSSIKRIGEYNRKKYIDKPLIAITGSVGKTTTKELIGCVLEKKYKVLRTKGNYNNELGVSLMLSAIDDSYDVIVLELGMNHLHEIDGMARMCKPNISVITNIGTSHIGYLRSKKNIFKAKMEITNYLDGGVLIVNGLDCYLSKIKKNKKYDVIKTVSPRRVNADKKLRFKLNGNKVSFIIPNEYLVPNIMIAYEIGKMFKMEDKDIIGAINSFKPIEKRSNVIKLSNGITLIDDSYNASMESVMASVSMLNNYKGKKLFILGDILELGRHSKKIHVQVGRYLSGFKDIDVLTVGDMTRYIKRRHFKDNDCLINFLFRNKFRDVTILIKGSRGMHLEHIKDYFVDTYSCQ